MSKSTIAVVTRMVLVADLIGDLEQLARHSPEKIEGLAASMAAEGLHQPIGIVGKRIIFGHGRWLSAKRLGWMEIEAREYSPELSETEWRIIRATENLQRTDLSGFDRWRLCEELLALNPSWLAKDLAKHLKLDPSTITHLLSPSKLNDAWKEALKAGVVTIADCTAAARVDDKEQHEMLAAKREGASAADLFRRARRPKAVQTVRASRVNIPLAGATVNVTGTEIGMVEVVDALSEALKEARRAAEQYDVKTFQSMMRDKAKKGGLPCEANP